MNFLFRFLRHFHCVAFAMLVAAPAMARPGDIDLSFNPAAAGMVIGSSSSPLNVHEQILLLPNGKVICTGDVSDQQALIGWLADGHLDPGFGNGGIVQPPADAGLIIGVGLQPDGKVLAACSQASFIVLRYLPDGTLDPSFGSGGRATLAIPGMPEIAQCVLALSDGKILVGGGLLSPDGLMRPRFRRMLPDGRSDPTFGFAEGLTLPGPGVISQMLMQPDGKTLATGTFGGQSVWLVRLDANGMLDTTFPGGGRFDVPVSGFVTPDCAVLALQRDGKILVGGDVSANNGNDFFVSRFHPDGSPDLTFNGGLVKTSISPGTDNMTAISALDDGKVLVAGTSGAGEAVLVRYLANGALDLGFGQGGIARARPPANWSRGLTMAVQPDGKILMGGTAIQELTSQSRLLLVRFLGGSLPQSFSGEWPAGTPLPNGGTVEMSALLRGDPAPPETTVTLRNISAVPLTKISATLTGTGAGHFDVLSKLPLKLDPGETMTLKLQFLPEAEVSSFGASLLIETGDPDAEDFLIMLRGETQSPVATLALSESAGAVAVGATVDFGRTLATHPVTKTFTIRNAGNIDLLLQGISLGAAGTPGDFTVTPPEMDVLAPGASTTFDVAFAPAGAGPRSAKLRIASTDTFQFPYEITLSGSFAAGIDGWRLTHFGTLLNEGDAADFSDPDGDGIVNLMEYATLTNPAAPLAPDPPVPGEVAKNGALMEYTFMRPAGAADQLIYSMEWSLSPEGPWGGVAPLTLLSNDGTQERVRFSMSVVNTPSRFIRLRVERR